MWLLVPSLLLLIFNITKFYSLFIHIWNFIVSAPWHKQKVQIKDKKQKNINKTTQFSESNSWEIFVTIPVAYRKKIFPVALFISHFLKVIFQ